MNENGNKVIYLSIEEFLIILFKYRIEGLIFPREITEAEVGGTALKRAMNAMVKDKYITEDHEELVLNENIRRWAEVLVRARETVVVSGMDGYTGFQYYYRTLDETAMLWQDIHHKGWVRIEYAVGDRLSEAMKESKVHLTVRKYLRGEDTSHEVIGE